MPRSVQSLLLALHSGIITRGVQRIVCDTRDQTHVKYIQNKHLTLYTVSLDPNYVCLFNFVLSLQRTERILARDYSFIYFGLVLMVTTIGVQCLLLPLSSGIISGRLTGNICGARNHSTVSCARQPFKLLYYLSST